ncbi:MAG: carbohydrate-binding protein, partial [Sphingobacteriales bacterium]
QSHARRGQGDLEDAQGGRQCARAAGDRLRAALISGPLINRARATLARPPAATQSPYNNTIVSLPGKVEVENYDLGGQGIAYNDATPTNEGTAYRNDAVDVQVATEGGYNVGWTQDGEWLEYTVNVTLSATYDVAFRTASTSGGAIRMEMDGVDVTGTVALANTGGWQTWSTTTKTNVALAAGQHILRLFVVTGGFNLNSVTVSPISNGPGFLHASGKNIVNKQGNYVLKTLNLGNFMVQEGYMLNLGGQYQHVIKQKIADVVGVANRDQFYDNYYNNFITKADIDSIAKWGFNSIRLPMHYNLFTPLNQPDVYIEKGFTIVDRLLGWCKEKNIYLILDLHAAPGGQSSGDISDYVAGQPSLWESAANREKTVKLWRKFAERYVNEEFIGGYDLINETNWTLANNNALLSQISH